MTAPIEAADNPCATCPFRKDTPPGIWSAEEYKRLSAWDGGGIEGMNRSVFLCHSASTPERQFACRGWMEVCHQNIGVRLSMLRIKFNPSPTKVPLYKSGMAARRAGLRGVKRPGAKALAAIKKLLGMRRFGNKR